MDFLPAADFADVPYGSLSPAACSPPAADRAFRGIVIRIPERIRVRADEAVKLPICGYYQLATLPLVQGAVMTVHVRGAAGTALPPVAGQVVINDGANEPDIPDPDADKPVDARLYAHKVSETWFFLDGQRYFKNQLSPGTYDVMVSYGTERSNTAQVTISRQ